MSERLNIATSKVKQDPSTVAKRSWHLKQIARAARTDRFSSTRRETRVHFNKTVIQQNKQGIKCKHKRLLLDKHKAGR